MNIERFRGDTKSFSVLLTDSGNALDLTGCTVKLTVNRQSNPVDNSEELFQLNGVLSMTPEDGIVTFSLSSTQANNVGFFFFDIQITDSTSAIFTVTKGSFVFKQDITKN